MKKAELQWNTVSHPQHEGQEIQSLNIPQTLEHLVEVINEMQEEIKKLTKK